MGLTGVVEAATVLSLWCRLTGTPLAQAPQLARADFLEDPTVQQLSQLPYDVLLEAGVTAARRGTLDLDEWLGVAHRS